MIFQSFTIKLVAAGKKKNLLCPYFCYNCAPIVSKEEVQDVKNVLQNFDGVYFVFYVMLTLINLLI